MKKKEVEGKMYYDPLQTANNPSVEKVNYLTKINMTLEPERDVDAIVKIITQASETMFISKEDFNNYQIVQQVLTLITNLNQKRYTVKSYNQIYKNTFAPFIQFVDFAFAIHYDNQYILPQNTETMTAIRELLYNFCVYTSTAEFGKWVTNNEPDWLTENDIHEIVTFSNRYRTTKKPIAYYVIQKRLKCIEYHIKELAKTQWTEQVPSMFKEEIIHKLEIDNEHLKQYWTKTKLNDYMDLIFENANNYIDLVTISHDTYLVKNEKIKNYYYQKAKVELSKSKKIRQKTLVQIKKCIQRTGNEELLFIHSAYYLTTYKTSERPASVDLLIELAPIFIQKQLHSALKFEIELYKKEIVDKREELSEETARKFNLLEQYTKQSWYRTTYLPTDRKQLDGAATEFVQHVMQS